MSDTLVSKKLWNPQDWYRHFLVIDLGRVAKLACCFLDFFLHLFGKRSSVNTCSRFFYMKSPANLIFSSTTNFWKEGTSWWFLQQLYRPQAGAEVFPRWTVLPPAFPSSWSHTQYVILCRLQASSCSWQEWLAAGHVQGERGQDVLDWHLWYRRHVLPVWTQYSTHSSLSIHMHTTGQPVSWHPELRTGAFWWSKVWSARMPLLTATSAFRLARRHLKR